MNLGIDFIGHIQKGQRIALKRGNKYQALAEYIHSPIQNFSWRLMIQIHGNFSNFKIIKYNFLGSHSCCNYFEVFYYLFFLNYSLTYSGYNCFHFWNKDDAHYEESRIRTSSPASSASSQPFNVLLSSSLINRSTLS